MTTPPRQLELPVLVDITAKASKVPQASVASRAEPGVSAFHKPASVDDQSIYKAISDNYFGVKRQA